MIEDPTLARFKSEARNTLETYLDRLTLPELQGFAPARPLELKVSASLRTTGPMSPQTLTLSVTPLKTRTVTSLITFGERTEPRRLEEFVASDDLYRIDELLT